jgi:hypothetical protein
MRHYRKPPWAARVIGGRMARLLKPSIVSRLEVPGRVSGRWHSTVVAVLAVDGEEYLLAAYGDTEWSRNLRSSGHGRLRRHGRVDEFTAQEVPAERLPDLVAEYRRRFDKMPTVGATFDRLPDPAHHPAFKITVAAAR